MPQIPVKNAHRNKRKTSQESKNDAQRIRALEKELLNVKKLNESLSEIQTLQNILLEKSLSAFCIFVDGKIYAMNPIAIAFTGYDVQELIGQESDFLVHPDDREAVKANARAMLKGERTSPYEFRVLTKQKEVRWVVEAIVPIMFRGKRAILANEMDITQRKQIEQKLIESENIYRTIFETTGTFTMIGNEDKKISLLNAEFEKLTGYRREDWEGKKSWTEYTHKDDLSRMEEYHRMRRINPEAVPKTYESRLIDSQGQVKHILVKVSMIPGTTKHVSSAMDITDLKEAEKELIRKSENLAELNTALKVLLKQREDDRKELETNLLSNVKEFVMPCIKKIREISPDKKSHAYIDLLASNLENILTPFSRTLSAKYMNLTSKEIEVANFIKEGKSSKEIAALLNVSSSCVDIHRYHIRKKLGLGKRRFNLQAYLKNL